MDALPLCWSYMESNEDCSTVVAEYVVGRTASGYEMRYELGLWSPGFDHVMRLPRPLLPSER